jgi:hypothetical protein
VAIIPLKLIRELLRLNGMGRIERLWPRVVIALLYPERVSATYTICVAQTDRRKMALVTATHHRSIDRPSPQVRLEAAVHYAFDILNIGARELIVIVMRREITGENSERRWRGLGIGVPVTNALVCNT